MTKKESTALELSEQFQLLRARIESFTDTPRTILVSSALEDDGKNACAYGLALEFEAAGYVTILIDIDYRQPTIKATGVMDLSQVLTADSLDRHLIAKSGPRSAMLSLSNAKLCLSASRTTVRQFLAAILEKFDKVVVMGPSSLGSGIGLIFATECDGVLITARERRAVSVSDRILVNTLANEPIRFLGVVSIARDVEIELLVSQSPRYSNSTEVTGAQVRGSQASGSKLLS